MATSHQKREAYDDALASAGITNIQNLLTYLISEVEDAGLPRKAAALRNCVDALMQTIHADQRLG